MRKHIPFVFIQPFFVILPLLILWAGVQYFQFKRKTEYSTKMPELRRIPAVSLPDKSGTQHRLDAIGKPGIVVFWASWCGPCREELIKLESYNTGNWSYTAINSGDKRPDAEKFLNTENIHKPLVLFDDEGLIGDIKAYPTVYVSFGDGTWGGPLLWGKFDEVMTEAKNMLAKADYKPLKESEERRKQYFESAVWKFYYSATGFLAVTYFLILLFLLRRVVFHTGFLRGALALYLLISILETFDIFNLGRAMGNSRHLFWTIVTYIYYSPLFWGGWIGLGVLIYLRQFLPTHKPENSLP